MSEEQADSWPPLVVPNGMMVLLGGLGRRPTRRMVIHSGIPHLLLAENMHQMTEFTTYMMAIKYKIDDLNEQVESGSIDRPTYVELVRNEWLNGVVQHFIHLYSYSFVPLDIRRAINNVCANINEPLIEWPEVIYVPIDNNSNPQSA